MADKVFAAERTRQAITAAEAGDIDDARQLLAEALTLDKAYELAWLWFAAVTEDDGEKKYCLERARALNSGKIGSPSLLGLTGVEAKAPAEVQPMTDPPPPDFVQGYVEQLRERRRRRVLTRVLAGVVVLALLGGVITLFGVMRRDPVYLAVVAGDRDPGALGGEEYLASAQWAVDAWNARNGNDAHPIELVTYVDDNDPDRARQVAEEIVADGRIVGVIGHQLTSTSMAAAPVYAQASIPAITPMATGDSLTESEWYFRTVFDNASQGHGIAAYIATVLQTHDKKRSAIVVSTDDQYGSSLRKGFTSSYGKQGDVQADIVVSADPSQQAQDLAAAAERIAEIEKPGPIVLASLEAESAVLADELLTRGVDDPTIVGTDALATKAFFTKLREVSATAINNGLAAAPLTDGSLTGEAVTFYEQFDERYGYRPSWAAGLTYDAVDAFAQAMHSGDISYGDDRMVQDRQAVRDVLARATSPESALQTLTGSLYFDEHGSAVRPVAMEDGRVAPNGQVTVETAQYQLAPYSPTAGVSLAEELANAGAVRFGDEIYTFQRVVTTGFNINAIDELNATAQTFNADFFVWFKFGGKLRKQTDVVFVNSVDPSLRLGEPERSTHVQGQNYVLYRVTGTFKAPMEFSDFPFDEQFLPIVIQHETLPAAKITYVPDPDNLEQSQAERLESGVDAGSTIDQIPNWQAESLNFFPQSVGNTASLGDPYFVAGTQGITYSQMAASNQIARDVMSFLVKNLLPLVLLTIVTYISLWLPFGDGARISFAVTGILTGAVMLASVTSSLPSVDYTVAIEWAYYAFIALSAGCVLVALVGRNCNEQRRLSSVRTLELSSRIAYPMVIAAILVAYWFAFR